MMTNKFVSTLLAGTAVSLATGMLAKPSVGTGSASCDTSTGTPTITLNEESLLQLNSKYFLFDREQEHGNPQEPDLLGREQEHGNPQEPDLLDREQEHGNPEKPDMLNREHLDKEQFYNCSTLGIMVVCPE